MQTNVVPENLKTKTVMQTTGSLNKKYKWFIVVRNTKVLQ